MLLERKNVSFRYDKKTPWILENISFSISNTERIGLIAPSGFGKTTLCKLLAGYETPTKGEILLDTKPLPKKGYCPVQMIWQHPEMAVNTKLPMKKILEEGGSISEEMIAKLGIQRQWFSRFAQTLSGGELQRFCIARALAGNPSFLLADEISTMLDLLTQSQIWHFLLEEVEKRNIGLLVVSHDMELLQKVTTKQIDLQKNAF